MKLIQTHLPLAQDAINQLAGEAMKEGILSTKVKELMAVALSIAVHCEPCIRVHLRRALQAGASEAELAETLAVTVLLAGGPAEVWPRRVIEEELKTNAPLPESGCCGGGA